ELLERHLHPADPRMTALRDVGALAVEPAALVQPELDGDDRLLALAVDGVGTLPDEAQQRKRGVELPDDTGQIVKLEQLDDRLSRRSHFRPRSVMGPLRAGAHESLEVPGECVGDVLPAGRPACVRVRPGRLPARARAGRDGCWRLPGDFPLGLLARPQLDHVAQHVEDGAAPTLLLPLVEDRLHFDSVREADGFSKRGEDGLRMIAIAHARDEPEVLGPGAAGGALAVRGRYRGLDACDGASGRGFPADELGEYALDLVQLLLEPEAAGVALRFRDVPVQLVAERDHVVEARI